MIHRTFKSLHNNQLTAYTGQAVASGGNFILSWWIARTMGIDTFGTFALLWSILLFALSMHQAFISQPLQTFAAKMDARTQNNYLKQLVYLQGVYTVLVVLLSILVSLGLRIMEAGYTQEALFMGGIIASFLFHDFNKKVFYLKEIYFAPLLLDSLLYGILFIIIYFQPQQLTDVLLAINIAYAGAVLVGLRFLPIQKISSIFSTSKISAFKTIIKKHYHFSKWLLGTALLQWATGNSFLIAAAGTLGVAAAGALRMGQHLVGLCHVLFLGMENIAPVRASQQLLKNGMSGLWNYLRNLSILTGLLTFGFLAVISLTAPLLVSWLYGAEYVQYTYIIWGYCILYTIAFWAYPLRFALRTLENTRPIFWTYVFSGGFALIAALPFARAWGINGILAGLIISQLITILIYTLSLTHKFYDQPLNQRA
ncbi:MAG: hypothetical protein MI974_15225 [Chitinophagales bacterium]|nr:hypothetical protein [Chitinophagales bacterium]